MDANGKVKIVGRLKELVIRGGENIYPKEIEELLHQHPDVQEAFVSYFELFVFCFQLNNNNPCLANHLNHLINLIVAFTFDWNKKVCGVPDDRLGEELCAWIKLKESNSSSTVDQMRDFCKDKVILVLKH